MSVEIYLGLRRIYFLAWNGLYHVICGWRFRTSWNLIEDIVESTFGPQRCKIENMSCISMFHSGKTDIVQVTHYTVLSKVWNSSSSAVQPFRIVNWSDLNWILVVSSHVGAPCLKENTDLWRAPADYRIICLKPCGHITTHPFKFERKPVKLDDRYYAACNFRLHVNFIWKYWLLLNFPKLLLQAIIYWRYEMSCNVPLYRKTDLKLHYAPAHSPEHKTRHLRRLIFCNNVCRQVFKLFVTHPISIVSVLRMSLDSYGYVQYSPKSILSAQPVLSPRSCYEIWLFNTRSACCPARHWI